MMSAIRFALLALTFVTCSVPAFADGRNVNDRIVYDYAGTQAIVRMPDGYPPRLAIPNFPRETATMTLSIVRVESDGTAIGTLATESSAAGKSGKVDVTLTRGGAIVPNVDLAPNSHGAMSTSCAPTGMDEATVRAAALTGDLEALDLAAAGVSKRAVLAVGDTWNVDFSSPDPNSPPMRVRYSVTGQQTYAGRPTFVIAMTAEDAIPAMSVTYSGTAYYDAASRIVAKVHVEKHLIQPNHMEMKLTSEFTLK
ncbi:MAG: hypothetical protein NVS4B13_00170 [Candidatus Elarobacter sp.]